MMLVDTGGMVVDGNIHWAQGLEERIRAALLRLVGSEEGMRIWMNAPNPQLEGKTPLSVVLDGQGEVVADMLEDMLMGQPA